MESTDSIKVNKKISLPKIESIVLLSFDNEIGQIVEMEYPPNQLPKQQLKLICSTGFPETNHIYHSGELEYIFRIRNNINISLKGHSITEYSFLYCYSLFIQRRKSDTKRGYIQKSIILVSSVLSKSFYFKVLYFIKDLLSEELTLNPHFLKQVIIEIDSIVLVDNIDSKENIYILENRLCKERLLKNMSGNEEKEETVSVDSTKISSEESDIRSSKHESPIINVSRKGKERNFLFNFNKNSQKWESILKSMTEIHQFNNFYDTLSLFYIAKLWEIWELIILEYPIIIYSDNVSRVSNIIFLLTSITHPLPLSSDIRPYFSIYDNDYKEYQDEFVIRKHNSAILGVINPIFNSTQSKNWPIVLRFDEMYFVNEIHKKIPSNPLEDRLSNEIINYYEKKFSKTNSSIYEVKSMMKIKKNFAMKGNKQTIKIIFEIIKSEREGEIDETKIDCLVRHHFSEMTKDFMKTIEEFVMVNEEKTVRRVVKMKKDFSIFEIFNKERFMKYIKENSEVIMFNFKYLNNKKRLISLYNDFTETKCFRNLLNQLLSKIKKEYEDLN